MQPLSVKECLSFGWRTFRSRPGIFISATAVLFLVGMVLNAPNELISSNSSSSIPLYGIIGSLLTLVLSFLLTMGKTAFYLRAHDEPENVELRNLWHPHPYWKFVGTALLAGIATVIGLILLIVPGIIIGIIVSFSLYIVIEKGLGPVHAIKESARITKGNRWRLFVLGLALLGINILGFCVLLVGLLVSLPVSTLSVVHAYRTLSKTAASKSEVVV